MAGSGGGGASLEYTPTWIVALVCTIIVCISLIVERTLHFLGKFLLKTKQWPLFQALQKIKEELMLLGFISLMISVFQDRITKICVPKNWTHHWLPCNKDIGDKSAKSTSHLGDALSFFVAKNRHLLAASSADAVGYCDAKGKSPLLSLKALHDLHIFIFVLAATHLAFSAAMIALGILRIRQWKRWEESIQQENYDPEEALRKKITHVQEDAFVKSKISGITRIALFRWLKSFFKQFLRPVKRRDYTTLRYGFIMEHCRSNPKFNFYKYMTKALENDFKKVVGLSWYLWIVVVLFLLLNVYGWHAFFWISFIPLAMLLAVGAKLEHIITQLAVEVAQKHIAVTGNVVVKPSDDHF